MAQLSSLHKAGVVVVVNPLELCLTWQEKNFKDSETIQAVKTGD